MNIIAVPGSVSARDASLIKSVVDGIVPEMRAYFDELHAPLRAENAELKERLKALEDRPAPEVIKGDPGESVDHALVTEFIIAEVSKAVAALPIPKDGERGKDAAGIVEALKDSGELVLTLADGRLVRTGVRDGKDGEKGADGFELTDYDEWFEDDGRTLVRRFVVGEDFKEFRHQTVLPRYRNVFKEGESYSRGDIVTWGGAAWHCEKETTDKPAAGECWAKMVNKGRDGKDAKNG